MNRDEFLEAMKKIRDCFHGFSEEKSDILFDKVKNTPIEAFSEVCNKMVSNSKVTPSIAEFLEMIRNKYLPRESFRQDESMFSQEQQKFLFELTRKCGLGLIPESVKFSEFFSPILEEIIKTKNKVGAHALFKETSEMYKIPYEGTYVQ